MPSSVWDEITYPFPNFNGWTEVQEWISNYMPHKHFLTSDIVTHFPLPSGSTVYPKKYAHGCVVLCFVVVMQSFVMNSHEVFIHIHQGCFAGTGAIVRLPQCQWSKPDGYGKFSQCITTTKHIKARTMCIFLGIYCMWRSRTYLMTEMYVYIKVYMMHILLFEAQNYKDQRQHQWCLLLLYDPGIILGVGSANVR